MQTADFERQKALGDEAELALAAAIRELHGAEVLRTTGEASYDLLVQQRVEVKRDLLAGESQHVAIETSHRGAPSGLATSTAHWWAFVVGDEALLIRTGELRALVKLHPPVRAGDGQKSFVRLLPLVELRKAAKLVRLV